MAELILYTNPMSRGRVARWMLEELGQPYRVEYVGYGAEYPLAIKSDAYRAINPMAKVPALKHGDVVVTEGAAICAYLADAFPQAGLKPDAGSAAAAEYYRWLFFAAGPAEAAITDRSLGVTVEGDKARMVGYGTYDAMVEVLAGAVAGRATIAGDSFTAADVYVGSQIGFGLRFGSLPGRPEFRAYWDGLTARPAYIRATALDDAALPKPA